MQKPVYVCRARLATSWVAGHLRPSDKMCLVSSYGKVHETDDYQILINIENTAKLKWVVRNKYTEDIPGTVIGGEEPWRNYVGRKPLSQKSRWDHILGYLDPKSGFGKYVFVNEKNEQMESEDGEVLVETEPYAYKLLEIEYYDGNKPQPTEELILGSAILRNYEPDMTAKVDSVIPYNFTYRVNWGHGHGLITGLPLHIYQKNRSPKELQWGVIFEMENQDVHQIEYVLAAQTAVNVTLKAKYVDADIPYSATLVSLYRDDNEYKRTIEDNLREAMLQDIIAEYSPVYFIRNNSLVPTTTTTTTTTTSTTTSTTTKKTTTVTEMFPIDAPNVEETTKPKIVDKDMENQVLSDDGDAVSLLTEKNEDSTNTSPSIFLSKHFVISTILFLILRFT